MQLQEFRDKYLEHLLQFLWRQWTAIGVAGYGEGDENRVIDPEALLLFSVSIARYDQRLFDEIIDWLNKNERFINVQRLRTILKKEGFQSSAVMSAVAGLINSTKSGIKWKGLAEMQHPTTQQKNLFYLKSGQPLPVVGEKDSLFLEYGFLRNPIQSRGMSNVFSPKNIPNLLLQLRALVGINSRSEVLLYLMINKKGTIRDIADQIYYAWRSIQDVLYEMGHSSIVSFPKAKKGRIYYLDADPLLNILLHSNEHPIQWICWPALFRVLEIIWDKLNDIQFLQSSTLEQSAEIKQLTNEELLTRITKAGFNRLFDSLSSVSGESYLKYWLQNVEQLLSTL